MSSLETTILYKERIDRFYFYRFYFLSILDCDVTVTVEALWWWWRWWWRWGWYCSYRQVVRRTHVRVTPAGRVPSATGRLILAPLGRARITVPVCRTRTELSLATALRRSPECFATLAGEVPKRLLDSHAATGYCLLCGYSDTALCCGTACYYY